MVPFTDKFDIFCYIQSNSSNANVNWVNKLFELKRSSIG